MQRHFVTLGALSGFASVAAGAFGAHALRASLTPEMVAAFETGARYQMYHALGLIAAGVMAGDGSCRPAVWAGWLFLIGTALFSGSLYALALTGVRQFGMITPAGGVAFLAGWLCLAFAARRG